MGFAKFEHSSGCAVAQFFAECSERGVCLGVSLEKLFFQLLVTAVSSRTKILSLGTGRFNSNENTGMKKATAASKMRRGHSFNEYFEQCKNGRI